MEKLRDVLQHFVERMSLFRPSGYFLLLSLLKIVWSTEKVLLLIKDFSNRNSGSEQKYYYLTIAEHFEARFSNSYYAMSFPIIDPILDVGALLS